MSDLLTKDTQYVANTYRRFPVAIVRGEGDVAYDEQGKAYIDLGCGIAVNVFGYADPIWTEAVETQLHTVQHTSNLYYTAPCVQLAEWLCTHTGMRRVFFGNSGAEANECAIKTARKWALDTKGPGHHTIITLKDSFHGRTVLTLAATGQDVFHTHFGPFPEGFVYATANDLASVRAQAEAHDCAAVMLEIVQGEGGIMPLDHEFLAGVQALCREKNMLLIVDEVQTGIGRTGALYAYMNHGLTPDIVTSAKGLGGGLPLGATLLGERVQDTLTAGTHGSTFGGNPVCCAGALSIVQRMDEALFDAVKYKAAYIENALSGAPGVQQVRGMGLMIGILPCHKTAKEVAEACLQRGVLVLTAKDRVRLLPPLTISMDHLEKAIAILKEVLAP